ncbi:hypothetical protein ABZ917_08270 [Nonomuraea wenchangensis]
MSPVSARSKGVIVTSSGGRIRAAWRPSSRQAPSSPKRPATAATSIGSGGRPAGVSASKSITTKVVDRNSGSVSGVSSTPPGTAPVGRPAA